MSRSFDCSQELITKWDQALCWADLSCFATTDADILEPCNRAAKSLVEKVNARLQEEGIRFQGLKEVEQERKAEDEKRSISDKMQKQMQEEISSEPGFKLDYLEVIDENSFEKVKTTTQNKRVIIAGWVNQVRLIDNMPMGNQQ